MSEHTSEKSPSKISILLGALKETAAGIKEGLKSKDGPTRRMSIVFLFCVLGIFFTAGFGVKYWTSEKRKKNEEIALAQKLAKEAAADDAAEAADLKKRPTMLSLGQFTIELTEKPGVRKAHGMMNLAQAEIYVSCDTLETCVFMDEHMVQVQNEVSGFFTPVGREEFLSISGKRSIRKALIERLNHWLPKGKIKDLYFIKMIIS